MASPLTAGEAANEAAWRVNSRLVTVLWSVMGKAPLRRPSGSAHAVSRSASLAGSVTGSEQVSPRQT